MIDLELIKQHCRIDHDVDDELLRNYSQSVWGYVESQLNRQLYLSEVPDDDPNGIVANAPIKQAMLMIIAHWYEHRESVVTGLTSKEIEMGAWRLIQPYRILGV